MHTLLDRHNRIAREKIERFGGRLIKTTRDGVLATFEGPGRGIDGAQQRAKPCGPRPEDQGWDSYR